MLMHSEVLYAAPGKGRRQCPTSSFAGVADTSDAGLLLAEADHRIANHLALLTGYMRLKAADLAGQAAEPSRDSVGLLLASVSGQINAVARLHRCLAADQRPTSADLSEQLHEICAPFASSLCGAARFVEDFPPGCVVRPEQLLPLSRIVAEVITNALKHAHADGEAGAILARCRNDDTGAVLIEVIDDGAGLPETFDPETDGGLGFRLLRALGKQLGALITFDSGDHGLRFRLTLPVDAGLMREPSRQDSPL
jgi:two-component sensor histidine kinase